MKTLPVPAIIAAIGLAAGMAPALAPAPAQAGAIERACLQSARASGNRALCGCIQHVADQTLNRGEQRQAARLFKDPQRAQDIRQSSNASHEVFWKRYKAFGATAEATCS